MINIIDWGYILKWGVIGICVFSILIIIAAITRIQRFVRDEEGRLRKDMPIAGRLFMFIWALMMLGFFIISSYFDLSYSEQFRFGYFFLNNFLIYLVILFYDTFIIDILVIVVLHPDFLNFPKTEGYTSIPFHLKTLIPGTLYGLALSLISSVICWYFL